LRIRPGFKVLIEEANGIDPTCWSFACPAEPGSRAGTAFANGWLGQAKLCHGFIVAQSRINRQNDEGTQGHSLRGLWATRQERQLLSLLVRYCQGFRTLANGVSCRGYES